MNRNREKQQSILALTIIMLIDIGVGLICIVAFLGTFINVGNVILNIFS